MRITECILIIGIQVGRNILGPHITFLQVIVFGTQFDNLPFVSAIRNRYAALRLSLVRIAEREVAPYVQFVFQKRSSKAGRILQHPDLLVLSCPDRVHTVWCDPRTVKEENKLKIVNF